MIMWPLCVCFYEHGRVLLSTWWLINASCAVSSSFLATARLLVFLYFISKFSYCLLHRLRHLVMFSARAMKWISLRQSNLVTRRAQLVWLVITSVCPMKCFLWFVDGLMMPSYSYLMLLMPRWMPIVTSLSTMSSRCLMVCCYLWCLCYQ